jgi:hypothetical protein
MMKNPLARFPDAGSFVAGLLIGLSILIPVFAMMVSEPGDWQSLWVFGAPTVLALGFLLQAVVIARPRHPHTTVPEPGAADVRFMGLSFER